MVIKKDLIPIGYKRRPNIKMKPTHITIHNTGCEGVPADNFRRSCLDKTQDKEVSFHIVVDEKEIIQLIPCDEVAWHCGDRVGNRCSIGIEICERDGSEQHAIELVQYLMREYNIPIENVVSHKSWSGKYCPRLILPHWDEFVANVKGSVKDDDLIKAVDILKSKGIINSPEAWYDMNNFKEQYYDGIISNYLLYVKQNAGCNSDCRIVTLYRMGIIGSLIEWLTDITPSMMRSLIIKLSKVV